MTSLRICALCAWIAHVQPYVLDHIMNNLRTGIVNIWYLRENPLTGRLIPRSCTRLL